MRKKPSPPGPKPLPRNTTVPVSSMARRANSAEGSSGGSATQRYMAALGDSSVNPASRSAATAASRRAPGRAAPPLQLGPDGLHQRFRLVQRRHAGPLDREKRSGVGV